MTQIKATAGKGREKNPFKQDYWVEKDTMKGHVSIEWQDFEKSVQPYPTYKDGKLFEEDGDFEAELVWQWKNPYDQNNKNRWDFEENQASHNHSVSHGYETRQVWNILPSTQTDKPIDMTAPDKKEYILCAAIHFDDGKQYLYQPSNISSGLVLCAYRHGVIFQQIGGLVKERQDLGIYEKEQGFLTSKNYFVSRENAAVIAFEAKQTDKLLKRLFSEDLY